MLKNRRALIHIGIEKTGTSTLQEFLHQNREILSQHGVSYLKTPGLRNHRKLVTYCMADNRSDNHVKQLGLFSPAAIQKWKMQFRRELVNEIANLSHEIKNIIISSEHFHSRICFTDEIQTLKDLLEPFFSELRIIVYLRRQDKTAVSLYSTACRVGFPMKRILPLIAPETNHYYNYYNLLEKWASVFGKKNIHPRIFEKEKLLHGDIISDFIFHSQMIKPHWDMIRTENQNRSLSAIAQEVMTCFNKYFPPEMNPKIIATSDKLRQTLLQKLEERFQGRSKLPCRQDALNFYNTFAESNSKLSGHWFNQTNVFSEDFSDYPVEPKPLTIEYEIMNCFFSVFAEYLSTCQVNVDD